MNSLLTPIEPAKPINERIAEPVSAAPAMDFGRLESAYREPYSAWMSTPSPETASNLLRAASPDIDSVIRAHVGEPNPVVRGTAKKLLLKSMSNYKPADSNFKTYMFHQLQGLKRAERKRSQGVSIPERMSLEHNRIHSATRAFGIDNGRDPTDEELSDLTHIDAERIRKVRKFQSGVAEGQFTDPETGVVHAPDVLGRENNTWVETVYADMEASPINQLILEHTLGLHGKKQLSNQDIAKKLNLSPGAISQRKAFIQKQLEQETELSPFLG